MMGPPDVLRRSLTSPSGGEVAPLGAGEGAFSNFRAEARPPHPSLRADLSPKGEVPPTPASRLVWSED